MSKTVFVIPTYNEAGNIAPLVDRIFQTAPTLHILIVDDSSPDGTADVVRTLQKQYSNLMLFVRPKKQGLGVAYRAGFAHAIAHHPDVEFLGMMDADFYHDPKDIPRLLAAASTADLVIGSVYAEGGSVPRTFSLFRRFLSRAGNMYCRLLFGYSLTDWTNGFAIIRVSSLRRVDLSRLAVREFAFIFGLKYALIRSGARWRDVGVVALERPMGESKVTLWTIVEALWAPIPMVVESRLGIPWQIVKFVTSGGIAAFTQLGLLFVFTQYVGLWYEYSLVIAFSLAFFVSFSLQKVWTFEDREISHLHKQMGGYLASLVVNLCVNALLLYVLVESFKVWYIGAQILIEILLATTSFLVYKNLVFRRHVRQSDIAK